MKKNAFFVKKLVLVLLFLSACQQAGPRFPAEKQRELANALYNRQLYTQSVAEYERYIHNYGLDENEQANISFIIGNIYFDRLKDYENALAYYERIKQFYRDSDVLDESEKRIVECLERLQRSADAQQALKEATFLDESSVPEKRPGEVIARIGDREFTTGDLEHEMNNLPSYALAQIKDQTKKVEFLKQIIATELLYNTASRKGLDRDKTVIDGTFRAKKNLMVQKLLQESLSGNSDFEEDDLHTYYRANIAKYAVTDSTGKIMQRSFEEARAQIVQDYLMAKQQSAYRRLVERMMRAEDVKIFEDKIK